LLCSSVRSSSKRKIFLRNIKQSKLWIKEWLGVLNIFRATSFSRFREKQTPYSEKFAVDEKGIYGGEEYAFKAAAHDMKVHTSRIC
jgi:hypothetical protein